jgi:hypothetical protein
MNITPSSLFTWPPVLASVYELGVPWIVVRMLLATNPCLGPIFVYGILSYRTLCGQLPTANADFRHE